MLRPGTEYAETIEIKRTFMHPGYQFPVSYNDISLSEVGRRIIFDFEKYGDSPLCFKKVKNHEGTLALVQGFGLTESGKQSGELLQTHVTVISNEKCAEILKHNISSNLIDYHKLTKPSYGTLKYGITDEIMCTLGIEDPDTGSISVRKLFYSNDQMFFNSNVHFPHL